MPVASSSRRLPLLSVLRRAPHGQIEAAIDLEPWRFPKASLVDVGRLDEHLRPFQDRIDDLERALSDGARDAASLEGIDRDGSRWIDDDMSEIEAARREHRRLTAQREKVLAFVGIAFDSVGCQAIDATDADTAVSSRARTRLLEVFPRLHTWDDESIAKWARANGRLGVCACGEMERSPNHVSRRGGFLCELGRMGSTVLEPLTAWRRYSRLAWALLAVDRRIELGEQHNTFVTTDAQWAMVASFGQSDDARHENISPSAARRVHTATLNRWQRDAPTYLVSRTDENGLRVTAFQTSGILGVVGLQLQQRLLRRSGLAVCVVCRSPLEAKRRTKKTCSDSCRQAWCRIAGKAKQARKGRSERGAAGARIDELSIENARLQLENARLRAQLGTSNSV